MKAVFFVALWFQIWIPVMGYGNGAPASTCGSMMPNHGVSAQSSPTPYTIEISNNKNNTFSVNQPVTVIIKGADYAGVLLQARSGSNTAALGSWGTAPVNTQYLTCSGNDHGAITHTNRIMKNQQTTYTWSPSASLDTVFFMATVVKDKTTFWVNVKSVMLSKDCSTGCPGSAADPKMATTPILLFFTLLLSTVFHYCF